MTITSGPKMLGAAGRSPLSPALDTGALVFVSGQLGTDPDTGAVSTDVAEQTKIALRKIIDLLAEAGLGPEHVAKTTIYVADTADMPTINNVYREFFATPHPARSAVAAGLVRPELKVEIEAIATRPRDRSA